MSELILVVEDNPDMQSGLKATLELEGYSVLTANNGQEALALLTTCLPNLILADLKMPHMDGVRLLEEIQKNETWRHIPVVVVSAVTEPGMQSVVTWRGAQAYITKPFELDDLLDAIAQALSGS